MLKNVIDFVISRTNYNRADALREINFAWKEIYNTDDLPNSLFEITVAPIDDSARISLPWYVGELRGVKSTGRVRVNLNTPRPYYQDDQYSQSIFVWRVLGTSPLTKSIVNATTLDLTFNLPVIEQTTVSLIGPNDNGQEVREQLIYKIGERTKRTVERFTDLQTVVKDVLTPADLRIINAAGVDVGVVPNSAFEAQNTIVQITDKCFKICNFCRCFDILYKKACPYLFYDETPVPYEEVLMAKTLEWIALPKDGQTEKAQAYGTKARELLTQFVGDKVSIEKRMDIGRSQFETQYYGKI